MSFAACGEAILQRNFRCVRNSVKMTLSTLMVNKPSEGGEESAKKRSYCPS